MTPAIAAATHKGRNRPGCRGVACHGHTASSRHATAGHGWRAARHVFMRDHARMGRHRRCVHRAAAVRCCHRVLGFSMTTAAHPAGMEAVRVVAISGGRAVPMMIDVVEPPSQGRSAKRQHLILPVDPVPRGAVDVGFAVKAVVARKHRISQFRLGRPYATMIGDRIGLQRAISLSGRGRCDRGTVHPRDPGEVGCVIRRADHIARRGLRDANHAAATGRDVTLQLADVGLAACLQTLQPVDAVQADRYRTGLELCCIDDRRAVEIDYPEGTMTVSTAGCGCHTAGGVVVACSASAAGGGSVGRRPALRLWRAAMLRIRRTGGSWTSLTLFFWARVF